MGFLVVIQYQQILILSLQGGIMLLVTLGPKNMVKAIWQHPALILMPTFSFWTYGPSEIKNLVTSPFGSKFLKLSFPLSWFNLIPIMWLFIMCCISASDLNYLFNLLFLLPSIIITSITFVSIQLLGRCSTRFQLEFTVFNPEKPDEVIPWPMEDSKNQETNEQVQMSELP